MGKLQEFYNKRYNQGLCIYCGQNSYSKGFKTCLSCREKRKACKSARQSKLINEDGFIITSDGEVKTVDDALNSNEFLMCGK